MIWKRRDAEFAEQGSSENPLRSPRLRVSTPSSFAEVLFERKDAKTQRRKDFSSDLCVLASLRPCVLAFYLFVSVGELPVSAALTQAKEVLA